jgi:glutathione synthase/RimK-type ligase-like ATP-grasp enzyme
LYLKDLAKAGVTVCPTVWYVRENGCPEPKIDLKADLATLGSARGFIKPTVGNGSSGALPFDASTVVAATDHVRALLEHSAVMVQPFLPSVQQGELSLVMIDGAFSHALLKIPAENDFRVQEEFGARGEATEPDNEAKCLATKIIEAVTRKDGLPPLYARVDLLKDLEGRWVLNELELTEPSLFYKFDVYNRGSAERLAAALVRRVTESRVIE